MSVWLVEYRSVLVVVSALVVSVVLGVVLGARVSRRRVPRVMVVPGVEAVSPRRSRSRGRGGVPVVAGRPVLVSADPLVCGSIEFPGGAGSVLVGRGHQLVLGELSQVSLTHCRLECTAGGWRVVDMGSRNGVLVDGRRVRSALLGEGSVLQLGVGGPRFVFTAVGSTVAMSRRGGAVLPAGRAPARVDLPVYGDDVDAVYPIG